MLFLCVEIVILFMLIVREERFMKMMLAHLM